MSCFPFLLFKYIKNHKFEGKFILHSKYAPFLFHIYIRIIFHCYEHSTSFAGDSCRNVCSFSYKCSLFLAKILTYSHSLVKSSIQNVMKICSMVPGVLYVRTEWQTDRQTDTHKTRIRPPLFKVFFFGERGETSVTDIILD